MAKFVFTPNGYKPIYKGIPPFMKYDKGYGYYGVLLENNVDGKLQCHLCGKDVLNLAKHIFHKHKKYTPRSYKEETGLSLTTPLVSESTRKKQKNNFLNLTEAKKREVIKRLRRLNKKLHSGNKKQRVNKASLQVNNKYGTCPEQVKSQFYEKYNELGRLPKVEELSGRLRYIIETRFGTYEEAVVSWGIPRQEYRKHRLDAQIKVQQIRAENDYYPKYTKEEVVKQYYNFFKVKGRLPTWGEVALSGMAGRIPFKRAFNCTKLQLENMLKNKQ